jgi:hypothetical protein
MYEQLYTEKLHIKAEYAFQYCDSLNMAKDNDINV